MEARHEGPTVWPAVLLSASVVGSAPFAGVVQRRLADPGSGDERLLTGVFAVGLLALLTVLVVALTRAGRRSGARSLAWRLVCVGAAGALAGVQILGLNREAASVNAVERFHYLSFGLIAILFFRFFRSRGDASAAPLTLIAVALVGVVDESVQHLVAVRTGDGLDIALNVYAGLCGLLVAVAVTPSSSWVRRPSGASVRLLAAGLALLTLAVGAFVDRAHLGYEVCDPKLDACFRSAFTAERLGRLAESRAKRWRTDPPSRPGPLDLEDHYQSEGMWRVLFRQRALQRGEAETARREAAILLEHFAPYVEVTIPQLLKRVEAEASASHYTSPVFRTYSRRLFVRPSRPVFWCLVLVLSASVVSSRWWGPPLLQVLRGRRGRRVTSAHARS